MLWLEIRSCGRRENTPKESGKPVLRYLTGRGEQTNEARASCLKGRARPHESRFDALESTTIRDCHPTQFQPSGTPGISFSISPSQHRPFHLSRYRRQQICPLLCRIKRTFPFASPLMSSPPRFFRDSSPAGAPGRKRSQFTYRHLSQLASSSSTCPLRVIGHIDLDCFYAQVEMVRLGIPEDKPLAVQQWYLASASHIIWTVELMSVSRQGLIAVNYPARAFGIGRHCTVTEARQLCPDLIAQHVATWREGDENFAYRPDAAEHIATDKVSLDPYRLECRRILAVIKDHLPPHLQKVEKASIDEVFVDLSAHVYEILLERFPELASAAPYDDPSEQLPMPPVSALDWQADALVDLDSEKAELDDPDWDDVAIIIGSEIVRNIRAAIKEKLHYTCSAGVARNKLLSKLGSAHKKPNQQTVIRNRAVQHFLSEFKFTKIRNLGGKLGEEISRVFNTELVSELLSVSAEQLKSRLADDTGVWVYNTIRGIDTSEVNPRTQIKSMLSAKSFRPSIDSPEQATKWLRIFAADIFSRLVEEGVLENKRRPKSANLYFRQGAAGGGQTRSRQMPIPQGKPIDEEMLFEIAKTLLGQIAQEGRVWPCSNLSLSIAGFEHGMTGNMGIGAFLVKGPEAQALKVTPRSAFEPGGAGDTVQPPEKRRRTDEGGSDIQRFLTKRETNPKPDAGLGFEVAAPRGGASSRGEHMPGVTVRPSEPTPPSEVDDANHHQAPVAAHVCSRCHAGFTSPEESQEHQDWHFAKDLHEQERVGLALVNREPAAASSSHTGTVRSAAAPPKRAGRPKKTERGQSKLNFG